MNLAIKEGDVVSLKEFLGTVEERGVATFVTRDYIAVSTCPFGGNFPSRTIHRKNIITKPRPIGDDELPLLRTVPIANKKYCELPSLHEVLIQACGLEGTTPSDPAILVKLNRLAKANPSEVRHMLAQECLSTRNSHRPYLGTVAQLLTEEYLRGNKEEISFLTSAVWNLFTDQQHHYFELRAYGISGQDMAEISRQRRINLEQIQHEVKYDLAQTDPHLNNNEGGLTTLGQKFLKLPVEEVWSFPCTGDPFSRQTASLRRPKRLRTLPKNKDDALDACSQTIQQYCFLNHTYPPDQKVLDYLPPNAPAFIESCLLSKKGNDLDFINSFTTLLPLLLSDTQTAWLLNQDPTRYLAMEEDPYFFKKTAAILSQAKLTSQQYTTIQETCHVQYARTGIQVNKVPDYATKDAALTTLGLIKKLAVTLAQNRLKQELLNRGHAR